MPNLNAIPVDVLCLLAIEIMLVAALSGAHENYATYKCVHLKNKWLSNTTLEISPRE